LHQARLVIFILTPLKDEADWLRLELALALQTDDESMIALAAGLYYSRLSYVVSASKIDEIYGMTYAIEERLHWERKPATEKSQPPYGI
jgi:hypothetical protein